MQFNHDFQFDSHSELLDDGRNPKQPSLQTIQEQTSWENKMIYDESNGIHSSPSFSSRLSATTSPSSNVDSSTFIPKLELKVTSPERVGEGVLNSHVKYRLDVKTTLRDYQRPEFNVMRRYSDFVWLREKLLEAYKGYLVPPLPEKTLLNRFSIEFMEYRRKELEKFLCRLSAHQVLSESPQIRLFLESENIETSIESKSVDSSGSTGVSSSGRFFSLIGSSIESISNNFTQQNEPDPWFDAKKNYILSLENQLNSLARIVNNLIKKRKESNQIWSELNSTSSLFCSVEADHDTVSSNSFRKLAEVATSIVALEEKRYTEETTFLEDAIRDYIRLIGAVKEMLSARTEKLVAYQNASKQVENKKEKLGRNKENSKLEKEIKEAEKRESETKQDFFNISNICKGELQRFEESKTQDFKYILVKFSQINVNFELQAADSWKNLLSLL